MEFYIIAFQSVYCDVARFPKSKISMDTQTPMLDSVRTIAYPYSSCWLTHQATQRHFLVLGVANQVELISINELFWTFGDSQKHTI